ncbi:MAG: glycoside hydrolase domain-containing protein [Promethearchaeota archaeon]
MVIKLLKKNSCHCSLYLFENMEITLATINIVGWVFFLFSGVLLSQKFSCCSITVSNNFFFSIMLKAVIIPLIIIIIKPNESNLIFLFLGIISWFILILAWFLSPYYLPIMPYTSIKIKIGIFTLNNPFLIYITGVFIIFASVSSYIKKVEEIIFDYENQIKDIVISVISIGIIGVFFQYIISLNILILFSAISNILLFKNTLKMEKNKQYLIEPLNLNSIYGVIAMLIGIFTCYFALKIGTATLFWTRIDIILLLIALGIIFILLIIKLFEKIIIYKINAQNPIFWGIYIIIGLCILIINGIIMLKKLNFSNSCYITNPPFLYSTFLSGIVLGLIIYSLFQSVRQYIEDRNSPKNIANVATVKFKRIYIFARFFIFYFLIMLSIKGIYNGLWAITFREYFKNNLIKEILFLVFFLMFFLILTVCFMRFRKKSYINKINNLVLWYKKAQGKRIHNKNSLKKNNFITFFLIMITSLSIILIPSAIPLKKDLTGFPNYLGIKNRCVIAEISSLSKIDKYYLIPDPPKFSNIKDTISEINHSMAKNEFETVQILISNKGLSPIIIENVSISNYTDDGLSSAFSLPPVMKKWNGKNWPWPRFEVKYVEEIQPGYPNILYILNGNQTRAQTYLGISNSKPAPIIKPMTSMALWIVLYSSSDLNEGYYSDLITIKTNKWSLPIKLSMHIWNFTIPTNHSFRTAIGNRRTYYLDTRDEFTKNFLIHRISPYFPYNLKTFYRINYTNNSVKFNFGEFEKDMENAINNGLDSFRINFTPYPLKNNPNVFDQAFNETTISFYSQLSDFLESKKISPNKTWLDLALVYALDEPEKDDYSIFVKWANLVHSTNPRWKVLLTEQVEDELIDAVDIWCPFIKYININNIPIQKSLEKEFWYYTCCNLVDQPTVSFVDPSIDHLSLFWCGWAMNFDGYLFGDAEAYINTPEGIVQNYDPYRIGFDGIGDAIMLLYDSNYFPIDTIVWDTMRDGLEDVEKFIILQRLNPHSYLLQEISRLWNSFNNYPKNYQKYLELEELVCEEINSLS